MRVIRTWIASFGAVIVMAGSTQGFLPLAVSGLRIAPSARGMERARAREFHGRGVQRERQSCRSREVMQMHKVTIRHGGTMYELEVDEGTSILEAALDNNIDLPHDCKLGVCLTCPSKVVSGDVDQSSGTLDDTVVGKGFALTCCSYPRSDVVIHSIEEDELVGAQFSDRT